MPQNRRAQAQPSLERARQAFDSAHFRAAAEELREIVAAGAVPDAAILLARTMLRLGDPAGALSAVSGGARARGAVRAQVALLKGVAFGRLGDVSSARAQFKTAQALARNAETDLQAEIVYQTAALQWMERQLERAEKTLDRVQAASLNLRLHVHILRGAIASANEDLPSQGAVLLQALRECAAGAEAEVYLYAMLVTQIAALSVELPSSELRDAALTHIDTVAWTADIADLHFHAARAVAWRHALDGDEFNAFRRLKEALAAATTNAWRVAALADRAYLAAALGEPRWAAQELRDAHELAGTIDWAAVGGEEKLALPVLAELFAPLDPAVAIGYASTFKALDKNFPRILSSRRDRRIDALESYSLGKVQLALGETAQAKRLLSEAWAVYDKLGIRWRAARAAAALADIDNAAGWTARAQSALASYPRSWLVRGRSVRTTANAPRPRVDLTAAQQTVLDLLLDGRSTDEIAHHLGRSLFTVRNHIKAILKAYRVSSRSALIVRAKG